ncbi:alpha/beta-hydrolase [Cantharellus anzutake]|uniref:alpha/beta-hydrolase n=1 Tax=Cantharellus anzutake TaxID=1750568 RepID=UPI0019043507|nr:alpha/beta-hydrolase [Cantharellus anzutake]KAF8328844.1 alpha/beta-hydrolase [Cantharellus anzutake]
MLTPILVAILLVASSVEGASIQEHISGLVGVPVLNFQLRHFHTLAPDGKTVLFQDVAHASLQAMPRYPIRVKPTKRHRPSSQAAFHEFRRLSKRSMSSRVNWEEDTIPGPDISSNETLGVLARMSFNAYNEPGDSGWYDLEGQWNISYPVGWESDSDGLRGHVFSTPDNLTVVLSIKGTSASILGGGGPTQRKDKLNDNLLYSCCCARVDWSWSTVCGCYAGAGKCDTGCLEESLAEETLFYPIGVNLYNNLTYMYPDANIWVTGHSLGGGLASLLGVTFGTPVVAFESPGERLAARRLHLPSPPSTHHITHVYHNADPIPLGACTGKLSTCYAAGYALESRCHLGKTVLYDTVGQLEWSVDIRTHGILVIIEKVLTLPWKVPVPAPEDDCIDCFAWEFGDFLNKTNPKP